MAFVFPLWIHARLMQWYVWWIPLFSLFTVQAAGGIAPENCSFLKFSEGSGRETRNFSPCFSAVFCFRCFFFLFQSAIDIMCSLIMMLTALTMTDVNAAAEGVRGELQCRWWNSRLFLWGFLVSSTYNLVCMTVERWVNFGLLRRMREVLNVTPKSERKVHLANKLLRCVTCLSLSGWNLLTCWHMSGSFKGKSRQKSKILGAQVKARKNEWICTK